MNNRQDPLLSQVLQHLASRSDAYVCEKSGFSRSTLRAWRTGKTQRPQALSLQFALQTVGLILTITRK